MPNGESKNWVRFQITLETFYTLHGKWPTVIHLKPFFINELQEKLSMEDFQKLQAKIRLEPDKENPFLSLDEVGNRFDYSRETDPNEYPSYPSVRAIDWLEIHEPTYFD